MYESVLPCRICFPLYSLLEWHIGCRALARVPYASQNDSIWKWDACAAVRKPGIWAPTALQSLEHLVLIEILAEKWHPRESQVGYFFADAPHFPHRGLNAICLKTHSLASEHTTVEMKLEPKSVHRSLRAPKFWATTSKVQSILTLSQEPETTLTRQGAHGQKSDVSPLKHTFPKSPRYLHHPAPGYLWVIKHKFVRFLSIIWTELLKVYIVSVTTRC